MSRLPFASLSVLFLGAACASAPAAKTQTAAAAAAATADAGGGAATATATNEADPCAGKAGAELIDCKKANKAQQTKSVAADANPEAEGSQLSTETSAADAGERDCTGATDVECVSGGEVTQSEVDAATKK